jgi:ribosome-binding protein aMBF1 (putative translation factor)
MAAKTKPKCRLCGTIKTKENTVVRGDGYLLDLCKECSSKESNRRHWERMSDEELQEKYEKYHALLVKIESEIERRRQ